MIRKILFAGGLLPLVAHGVVSGSVEDDSTLDLIKNAQYADVSKKDLSLAIDELSADMSKLNQAVKSGARGSTAEIGKEKLKSAFFRDLAKDKFDKKDTQQKVYFSEVQGEDFRKELVAKFFDADGKPIEFDKDSKEQVRTVDMPNSPFALKATLSKNATSGEAEMKFEVEKASNWKKNLPDYLRDPTKQGVQTKEVAPMIDEVASSLSDSLKGEVVKVKAKTETTQDKDGKDVKKTTVEQADVDSALKNDNSAFLDETIFQDLRKAAKDMETEQSDKGGAAGKEIEMRKTKAQADEKLRELGDKKAVLSWLSSNSGRAGSMKPCEVAIAALGWERLNAQNKQECAEFAPKKKEVEETKKAKDEEEQNRSVAAQSQAISQDFMSAVAGCMAAARNQAAAAQTKQITDPFQSVYQKLLEKGFVSECIATTTGPDPLGDEISLGPNSGDMGMNPGQDLIEKAQRSARSLGSGLNIATKLANEREAVGKVLKVAGGTLGMVAGSSPEGLNDPNIQQSPQVRNVMRYYAAAQACIRALDEQIALQRAVGGPQKYRALNGTGGGQGAIQVPQVGAGASQGAGSFGPDQTGTATDRRQLQQNPDYRPNQRPALNRGTSAPVQQNRPDYTR